MLGNDRKLFVLYRSGVLERWNHFGGSCSFNKVLFCACRVGGSVLVAVVSAGSRLSFPLTDRLTSVQVLSVFSE